MADPALPPDFRFKLYAAPLGALGGRIVINFHEPKTASLPSKAITHDSH